MGEAKRKREQLARAKTPEELAAVLKEQQTYPLLPHIQDRCLNTPGMLEPLLQLLEDDIEGMGSVHAATLLGKMRATEAIEPLLDSLGDLDSYIHSASEIALGEIGAPAFGPVWERWQTSEDEDVKSSLEHILSHLGVKDERLWVLFQQRLKEDPVQGALLFAEYKDLAALPLLIEAFDKQNLSEQNIEAEMAIIELAGAIHELQGSLTPEQTQKLNQAKRQRRIRYNLPP